MIKVISVNRRVSFLPLFQLIMTGISVLVYLLVKKLLAGLDLDSGKKDTKHQRYPLLTSAGMYKDYSLRAPITHATFSISDL